MSTVLGLDLGPNSIGWAIIYPENNEIIAAGVRVFPEGVDNYGKGGQQESKNVSRRIARGMRRQNQRFKMRRDNLVRQLRQLGMYPNETEQLNEFFLSDPYEIRAEGLDRRLTLFEFGRALYHINERRGFKSNRKAGDSEDSKIFKSKDGLTGINDTLKAILKGGFRTLGEYLNSLNPHQQRRRSRYTKRNMYEDEFDLLWEKQKEYHNEILTEESKVKIHDTIFSQRKLKSQKNTVAKCTFEPKKRCAPKSSPTFQYYRILEQIARLRVTDNKKKAQFLTQEERNHLAQELNKQEKMTFKQVSKCLDLSDGVQFNIEYENYLIGNRTEGQLAKVFGKKVWYGLTAEKKYEIWHTLHFSDDPEWLKTYVQDKWGLDEDAVKLLMKVSLENGYCRLSQKAMSRITPFLEKATTQEGAPMTYDKAVKAAGYHHSDVHDKAGGMMKLPPPPDIRNPIVQQSLNELRKLTNAIVDEYGNPDCIKVELVRELKLPRKRRERIFFDNRQRKAEHERIRNILREDVGLIFPSIDDVLKYRLWEECAKVCTYTGNKINSIAQLFNGDYEIEHILPYSRSLDDSFMNKTLCHRNKNAEKGNRTPWEAWGNTVEYEEIIARAKKLPYPKYRRFIQKELKEDDFIQRQLNDTAYIAKEVRKYLTQICTDVRTVPGTATARLRRFWGLNTILSKEIDIKNREDHRHHAVDALVVANTERKYIQHLSTYHHYKREVKQEHFPSPWPSFRADAEKEVNKILVSHKVKNNIKGKLHQDSYYGLILNESKEPRRNSKNDELYGIRKSVIGLTVAERNKIPDKAVLEAVKNWYNIPKEQRSPFPTLPSGRQIKRVRIHDVHSNVIELRPSVYVEPGNNHHIVIFENKETGKRRGKVVSLFKAAQRKNKGLLVFDCTPPDEHHRFLMSLSINEMVLLNTDRENNIKEKMGDIYWISNHLYRVQKINFNGRTYYRKHTVAILKDENKNEPGMKEGSPNSLRGSKVACNLLGQVHIVYD